MYAAIAAYLSTSIVGAIKRQAVIYAMYAAGALLVVFAGGYGVNALHAMAMFRFGGVTASLIIAGGFVVTAMALFGVAYYLGHQSRPAAANTGKPLYSTLPHYSRGQVAFAAGALAATVAAAVAVVRRLREKPHDPQAGFRDRQIPDPFARGRDSR